MAGLDTNSDFLSQGKSGKATDNKNKAVTDSKKNAALKEIMEKYPEYCALDSNQRNSLDATNYWRVMGGLPIIEVPPSDTEYHKYFDSKCYDRRKAIEELNKKNLK